MDVRRLSLRVKDKSPTDVPDRTGESYAKNHFSDLSRANLFTGIDP